MYAVLLKSANAANIGTHLNNGKEGRQEKLTKNLYPLPMPL